MAMMDILADVNDPKVIKQGMDMMAASWSPMQQWSASNDNRDPVSTTITVPAQEKRSQDEVYAMLSAAVGSDGWVSPSEIQKPGDSRRWDIEFESLEARVAFEGRLQEHQQDKGTVVDPAQLTVLKGAPARQAGVSR